MTPSRQSTLKNKSILAMPESGGFLEMATRVADGPQRFVQVAGEAEGVGNDAEVLCSRSMGSWRKDGEGPARVADTPLDAAGHSCERGRCC